MSYGLYLAKVIGAAKKDDLRVQIRVVPQMNGIPQGMCPRWPYFFKEQGLVGSTGDLVWVICNDDFSLGYILGTANYNTYVEDPDFSKYSLSTELQESVTTSFGELGLNKFSFTDLKVTYWNNDCIHMIEKSSGGVIYAYRNGTLFVFRNNEFIVKIKNGSRLSITETGISMTAPTSVAIDSPDVGLGKNPQRHVVVTSGSADKVTSTSNFVRA